MWKNDTNTNNTYLKKYLLSPRAISCTEVCYIPFVSLFLRISFTQLVSSRIFSFFSRFHIYLRCKYANESKTSSSPIIKKKKQVQDTSYIQVEPHKLLTLFHKCESLVPSLSSFIALQTKSQTAHACFTCCSTYFTSVKQAYDGAFSRK